MTTEAQSEVLNKVAIVTGAASGIGLGIVELLHNRGAKIVAVDASEDVKKLEQQGIATLAADVTKDGVAEHAVHFAATRFGGLDVLVNNAGRILYKELVEMTREEWDWFKSPRNHTHGANVRAPAAATLAVQSKS
jgi:NAD(P)-dependent dehydrogenase (short-subunit alcohol dehydrogenase family)